MSIPVAMTIDFAWPWWAYTAIALGVAATSIVLFVFVRHWFARGIFVTLVLQGAIIAAVAPVVMGNSSSSSSTAMSAGGTLTRTQFAQQADANCHALTNNIAALGNPKTLPGITHKLDVVIPAYALALQAQHQLPAPAGEAGLKVQWMHGMTRYWYGLKHIRAAASSGNASAVAKANKLLAAPGAVSARTSKELGLNFCFQ